MVEFASATHRTEARKLYIQENLEAYKGRIGLVKINTEYDQAQDQGEKAVAPTKRTKINIQDFHPTLLPFLQLSIHNVQ